MTGAPSAWQGRVWRGSGKKSAVQSLSINTYISGNRVYNNVTYRQCTSSKASKSCSRLYVASHPCIQRERGDLVLSLLPLQRLGTRLDFYVAINFSLAYLPSILMWDNVLPHTVLLSTTHHTDVLLVLQIILPVFSRPTSRFKVQL